MSLHIRLELDSITFRDLCGLVDLDRAAGLPLETKIGTYPLDTMDPDRGPEGLEVALDGVGPFAPPVTLLADEARELASDLGRVIDEDGDARGVLVDLNEWRDRLLDLDRHQPTSTPD